MRGAFIKEHGFHRCARIGLFTDRLVLRRIPRRVSMRRRRDGWARILRMRRVVSMRARFSGHVPKGQKFIAQGKRSDTLGIMCRAVYALQGQKYWNRACYVYFCPYRAWHGAAVYPGRRFACPGLWRSLGFQPA